nr:type II toxin-antitoxin system YoeB family toxin [Bifidobacterium longum]
MFVVLSHEGSLKPWIANKSDCLSDYQRWATYRWIQVVRIPWRQCQGYRSRRIDEKNRIVYRITGNDVQNLEIAVCRTHYGEH